MKGKMVNTSAEAVDLKMVLSNEELQSAIDSAVSALKPSITGGVDEESKKILRNHLSELLTAQRVRSTALMSMENPTWTPGEKCYWGQNGEAVFIGFCPSDKEQCAIEHEDKVKLALVEDLRKLAENSKMKDKLVNVFLANGVNVTVKKPLNLNELKIKYEDRSITKEVLDEIKVDISYFDMQIQAGFTLREWEKKAYLYLVNLQRLALACALGSVSSSVGDK